MSPNYQQPPSNVGKVPHFKNSSCKEPNSNDVDEDDDDDDNDVDDIDDDDDDDPTVQMMT